MWKCRDSVCQSVMWWTRTLTEGVGIEENVLRGSRGPSHEIERKKDEEVTSTQVSQFQGQKSDFLVRY